MFYQLLIKLDFDRRLKIGELGIFDFPKGYYVYTGSARKNFSHRISRHIKRKKKYRWHIDYLRNAGKIIQIKKFFNPMNECKLHNMYLKKFKGRELINGFGASDCNCWSHLIYIGKKFRLIK